MMAYGKETQGGGSEGIAMHARRADDVQTRRIAGPRQSWQYASC